MEEPVQPIFEFGAKLRVLQDWAATDGDVTLTSENGIARKAKIPQGTFRDNLQKQQMTPTNQRKLANVFGFEADWHEWRDPNAIRNTAPNERRDTAKSFTDKFLAAKSKPVALTVHVEPTRNHIDHRVADFRFNVSLSHDPITAPQEIPLLLSVSFDRRGYPKTLENGKTVTVGLKQADLELIYDRDRSGRRIDAFPIECRNEDEGNFRATASKLKPWWVISIVAQSTASWLMGERLRNDGNDCVLLGFHRGDRVQAVLKARVSDCFVDIPEDTFEEEVSRTKLKLVRQVLKLDLLEGVDEAILADQVLTVVERHE